MSWMFNRRVLSDGKTQSDERNTAEIAAGWLGDGASVAMLWICYTMLSHGVP